jgi:hypothetical protein
MIGERMTYVEFRERIRSALHRRPAGYTWAELRDRLDLPYDRPCPTWTKQLEQDIGLTRGKPVSGRAHVWTLAE